MFFNFVLEFRQYYWLNWTGDHVVLTISNKLILNNVLQICVGILMLCINWFLKNRNCRYYEKNVICLMKRKCKQWWWTMPLIWTTQRFSLSRASTWISNIMFRVPYVSHWFWGERWFCWYWLNTWPSWLNDFERTWWRLFQKRVVRTKFDIYVLFYNH